MSTRAGEISIYFYSTEGAREEKVRRRGYDLDTYAQVLARLGLDGWEMISELEGWIPGRKAWQGGC